MRQCQTPPGHPTVCSCVRLSTSRQSALWTLAHQNWYLKNSIIFPKVKTVSPLETDSHADEPEPEPEPEPEWLQLINSISNQIYNLPLSFQRPWVMIFKKCADDPENYYYFFDTTRSSKTYMPPDTDGNPGWIRYSDLEDAVAIIRKEFPPTRRPSRNGSRLARLILHDNNRTPRQRRQAKREMEKSAPVREVQFEIRNSKTPPRRTKGTTPKQGA